MLGKFTDYGRPMKPIFIEIISTHFVTVKPLSMFFINQPLFLQKTKPIHPNPEYLFGIGI